ncbi:MAG: hypothetical protein Q9196_004014 [Gyalolechia fulgens]
MANFKTLCKQLLRGKKVVPVQGSPKETSQSKESRHLLKKVKESFTSLKARRSSISPGPDAVTQTQSHGMGGNGPASTSPVASPAIQQDATNQSPNGQSSGESSTWSPPGRNVTSSCSSPPSPEQSPPTFVCELPTSNTFDNASTETANEDSASKDVAREGAAKHWGAIASSIHRQQLEDPLYQHTLHTPAQPSVGRRDISPPAATTKAIVVEALGIFERSVQEEALRTFLSNQDLPSSKEKNIPAENEDSGLGDVDASGDKGSIKSQTPSSWERAIKSRERSHKNEMEDLRDDHAAEVGELRQQIAELQAEAKAAQGRKAYIEKTAKKIADKQATQIAQQKILLDAANAEISSKELSLQEQAMKADCLEKL